jgi:hypothetical protein
MLAIVQKYEFNSHEPPQLHNNLLKKSQLILSN